MIRIAGALVAVVALGACGEETLVIAPVIDGVVPELEEIELSVAIEGSPTNLVSARFERGQPLELPGVPYGENLVIHMVGYIAGDEVAAGRTCKFSVRPEDEPPTPHLFFGRGQKWVPTDMPPSALREAGTAITHVDGSAVFIGGRSTDGMPVLGVDRFDPYTGAFEELTTLDARRFGAAAQLGDGRIVVAGGIGPDAQPMEHLELITVEAPTPDVRRDTSPADGIGLIDPVLVSLGNGKVMAFGGRVGQAGDASNTVVQIEVDGAGVQFLPETDLLATPRYGHTVTAVTALRDAPLVIIGGASDETGMLAATAEVYRPLTEDFAPPADFAPQMQKARRGHRAIALRDGSILILGGVDAAGAPVLDVERFAFDSGFSIVGTLPPNAGIVDFTVTPLPDGRLLYAGGRRDGAPIDNAYIIDFDQNGNVVFPTTDTLAIARAGHQATLLCDGTVLLVGGTLAPSPAERYNPFSAGRR